MKIGLSYGRCVRDIVKDIVDIDDVLIIVSKTAIKNRDEIPQMIQMYSFESTYLKGLDLDMCELVANMLWDQGKIYQPRLISDNFAIMSSFMAMGKGGEVWCDLLPSYTGDNPMIDEAYNNYLMIRKLAE